MDPIMHPDDGQLPQVEIEVYSYGGCTSCGNSMWNWFRQQNLKVIHTNVQVESARWDATRRAMDLGLEQREVYFPLIFVGGKVIVGFKPNELQAIINEIREG